MGPVLHNFRRTVAANIDLRLLERRDAEPIFAAVERDREYLRQWLPWVDRTESAQHVRAFIEEVVIPQWSDNRGPQCGIWVDGELAGSVGCHPIDWANRLCSIGYWVESRRQGQGIVSRSVSTMLNYLFEEECLHRVVIQCATGNVRSCAIPLRLGFVQEGVLREAELVGGRWLDLVTWGMLEQEWRQRTQAAS